MFCSSNSKDNHKEMHPNQLQTNSNSDTVDAVIGQS